MPNDELCAALANFDLGVLHSEFWECSKSLIEMLLVGLPVVINRRHGPPVPELTTELVRLVESTPRGYADAIAALLRDDNARTTFAMSARHIAQSRWSPAATEAVLANVHREYARS